MSKKLLFNLLLQDSLREQLKVEQYNEDVSKADGDVKSREDQLTALKASVNCCYPNCVNFC